MGFNVRNVADGLGKQNSLTVTTTAQQIDVSALSNRFNIEIFNDDSTNDIFVGFTSSVASSGANLGRRIQARSAWSMDIPESVQLWVICATGSPVAVLTQLR